MILMMQTRRRPSAGYCISLHTRSTADLELPTGESKKSKRRLQLSDFEHLPGGVFKVERLITHKASKVAIQH